MPASKHRHNELQAYLDEETKPRDYEEAVSWIEELRSENEQLRRHVATHEEVSESLCRAADAEICAGRPTNAEFLRQQAGKLAAHPEAKADDA